MTSNIRPRDKRLYVLDREMTQARVFSTLYQDGQPRRWTFPSRAIFALDMEGEDGEAGPDVSVYEDIVCFSVFETTEQGHVLYVAFPSREHAGLIIVGDYFRLGARQIVVWW